MGHTEVRNNDVQWITSSDQDVCSAEVTMDDAQRVQVVHASRTLLQDGDRGGQLKALHSSPQSHGNTTMQYSENGHKLSRR